MQSASFLSVPGYPPDQPKLHPLPFPVPVQPPLTVVIVCQTAPDVSGDQEHKDRNLNLLSCGIQRTRDQDGGADKNVFRAFPSD